MTINSLKSLITAMRKLDDGRRNVKLTKDVRARMHKGYCDLHKSYVYLFNLI